MIRQAREGDYGEVSTALQTWWTQPGVNSEAGARERAALVPRLWLQHFATTSLLAERDERMIGFLVGFLSQDRADEGYIHFVGISPEQWGRGTGRALYERFFAVCRKAGRSTVRCVTSPQNSLSIAFHTAMGFLVEPGTEPAGSVTATADYDGLGVHRVAFVRTL